MSEHDFPQIYVTDKSNLLLKASKVYSGQGNGICIIDSNVHLKNCQLYKNSNDQISATKGSTVTIQKSEIYQGSKETYGLYISESRLEVEESEISEHDYPQIYVLDKSNLLLKSSKVHSGQGNGIRIIDSNAQLKSCQFYQNNSVQISVTKGSTVTIQKSGIYRGLKETNGLYISESRVEVEDSAISEHDYPQIYVENHANLFLKASKVLAGKKTGIVFTNNTTGTIENCEISNNEGTQQVHIEAKSNITLFNCRISNGKRFGVRVTDAKVDLIECELFQNGDTHIDVDNGSIASIRNSKVYQGNGKGVFFNNKSTGTIEDCDIYENASVQLDIDNESRAEVERCKIFNGTGNGIRVMEKSKARIEECDIYGHPKSYPQVVIKTEGNPTIKNCEIYGGLSIGIWILENGRGIIEECYIYRHRDAFQIHIANRSEPTLRNNRIIDGGEYGIYIENSNPIIENCTVIEHAKEDIFADENSSPIIIQANETIKVKPKPVSERQKTILRYEQALGFNPYELERDELKIRLQDEQKKWLKRINAPSMERRHEAEMMLELIEEIEKEIVAETK